MGICISTNRHSVSGDEVSQHGHEQGIDTANRQGGNATSRARSAVLQPLSPRCASREEARFPFEAAAPLTGYLDAVSLAHLSVANPEMRQYLPEARQRARAEITADVQREVLAPGSQPSGALRSFRRVRSLSDEQRVDLLSTAVSGYHLRDDDGDGRAVEGSRAGFASLCEEIAEMRHHPRFPDLASELVNHALAQAYDTGEDWNTRNRAEPLIQVLSVVAHLPEGQRRELARFMKGNIVPMIMTADRQRARDAIDEMAPRRRRGLF
ncbi:hypothetical protein C0Z17_15135 [Trinickia caryophylli]|nr:hypothetical protein C0Z17_15135 [Trinickia caryophylli]